MTTAKADYPFRIERHGEDYVFTYDKAKFGFKMFFFLLWPSLMASGFLSYRIAFDDPYATVLEEFSMFIFYWIFLIPLIAGAAVILLNLFRRPGTFAVNPDGIKLQGVLYPYKDIRSLYIKGKSGEKIEVPRSTTRSVFIFGGDRVQNIGAGATVVTVAAASTVVSAASQVSNLSGQAIGNNFKSKSFKICFMFGNKEMTVAHQITQQTASLLLSKMGEQE